MPPDAMGWPGGQAPPRLPRRCLGEAPRRTLRATSGPRRRRAPGQTSSSGSADPGSTASSTYGPRWPIKRWRAGADDRPRLIGIRGRGFDPVGAKEAWLPRRCGRHGSSRETATGPRPVTPRRPCRGGGWARPAAGRCVAGSKVSGGRSAPEGAAEAGRRLRMGRHPARGTRWLGEAPSSRNRHRGAECRPTADAVWTFRCRGPRPVPSVHPRRDPAIRGPKPRARQTPPARRPCASGSRDR